MIPIPTFVGELGLPHAPPPLAISHVGTRTGSVFGTSFSLTQPTTMQPFDVGILVYQGAGTISPPAGWISIATRFLYRIYDGTEGNVVITNTAAQNMCATLSLFRNVHPTDPLDAISTRPTTSGSSFPANAVVAEYPRTLMVSAVRCAVSSGTQALTEPTGTTRAGRITVSSYSTGVAYGAGPENGTSTSASPWTGTVSTFDTTHMLALLRPADT